MPIKINQPTSIEAAGNKYKRIEEFFGKVNSKTSDVSIARIVSPPGWIEPGQKSEFTECIMVFKGVLQVKTESKVFYVYAGEGIKINANEWVQYSTPDNDGVEYYAICVPAFSQDLVHRD